MQESYQSWLFINDKYIKKVGFNLRNNVKNT